jgi:VanZ family protein
MEAIGSRQGQGGADRRVRTISVACLIGAILVTIGVLIGTHLPPTQVPGFVMRLAPDKVWHAAGYGSLAFLLYGGLRPHIQRRRRTVLWVILAAATLSAFDELTQPLTGRNRDVLDFLASTGGAVVGAGAAVMVGKMLSRRLMGKR